MLRPQRLVYLLGALGALLLVYCNQGVKLPAATAYLNLQDSVAYVGMQTCRSCHATIHESFAQTGMGLSFDFATPEKSSAQFGDHALVYDEKSNFHYRPYFQDDTLYIQEFRLDGRDTVHNRTEKVSYIVGSGQHTNSHILDINGYVYQAPITYYTQEDRWDMAPGFRGDNVRFSRLLTTECITCHNHYPEFVEGSLNKYERMPTGIECERCHGPGEIHVREKLAGNIVDTSRFIDPTIVNPRDLPRDLVMDLCQRCHLQGVAVLEEGKTFFDFKPGMRLNEVVNVFLPRYTDSHEKFIMASQADRLQMSPCYVMSDEMSCLTCHHPHHSVESTPRERYNAGCISCHQEQKYFCSVSEAERLVENDDCARCHMRPSGSIDIPHVNITDHYIHKSTARKSDSRPVSVTEKAEVARFLGLELLTKEVGTPLDMARGYIALFDKYVAHPQMLDSAGYYLRRSRAPFEQRYPTDIHYHFARQDFDGLLRVAQQIPTDTELEAWTAYRIGEAYFQRRDYFKALRHFKWAVAEKPFDLDFQQKLGSTHLALQNLVPARQVFEFILRENPKRPRAWTNLGYIFALQGQLEKAENHYFEALALDPDAEQALVNLAALRLLDQRRAEARELLERALRINPDNQQARDGLARMGVEL
ncbi:MAG: tetratricopeptide repeat protein [Bacteroidota bacterium]